MRRTIAVVALVVAVLSAPGAAGAPFGGLSQQSVDADVVVMTAGLGADGDANWTIAYRIRLATDNETQAFEGLQRDIRTNTSAYTDRFGERMNRTASTAQNATGREMTIRNLSVETTEENVGQRYGVVTYRFEWANFAAVEDGRLTVGDAIGGLFLDSETSLTISWPDDYRAERISPQPDAQSGSSVTWRGQQSFEADEPRVVLGQSGPAPGDGPGVAALVAFAVVVFLLIGGGYVAYRSFGGSADTSSEPTPSEDGDTADGDGSDEPQTPPTDLLSNEEQVLQLLDANGGRLKQQQVASELDWTDAKTSQVISGLREDGELETFRIGRENVVTLPDTDVAGDSGDE